MADRPVDHNGEKCHCDYNPETTQGPEEDCPLHGRPYSYWVSKADEAGMAVHRVEQLCDRWDRTSKGEYATTRQIRQAIRGE